MSARKMLDNVDGEEFCTEFVGKLYIRPPRALREIT